MAEYDAGIEIVPAPGIIGAAVRQAAGHPIDQ